MQQIETLKLTLNRHWFNMIANGEKKEEYRLPSRWIMSRLVGKQYERVRFTNGYYRHAPFVECEYRGWGWGFGKEKWGGVGRAANPIIVIKLGKVTRKPL